MKIRMEGKSIYLKEITCPECEAHLDINPPDCVKFFDSAYGHNFFVDCQWCGARIMSGKDSVPIRFWNNIPTQNTKK